MQSKVLKFALGLVAAGIASSAFGQIKWAENYSAALTEAKSSNKIMMVEFYTTWDPNGKVMDERTFRDDNVVKLAGKFVPVRLDAEKDGKDLAKTYKIKFYPTILFIDKEGNDVGTIDGVESPDEFVKHANVFLKDVSDKPGLEASHKANPQDLTAVAGLGTIEANRYHISTALTYLTHAESIDPSNGTDKISDLYNAIGDFYQNASQFDKAMQYFQKSADTSKVTDKKAYALLSIATCYMTMDPEPANDADLAKARDHIRKALPLLEETLKLPNLKAEDRQIAESDLKVIKQALGGG